MLNAKLGADLNAIYQYHPFDLPILKCEFRLYFHAITVLFNSIYFWPIRSR